MKTIELLKCIRRVMEKVKARDGEIKMGSFYENYIDEDTTIEYCYTPACVLGWCSLDEEFKSFLYIIDIAEYHPEDICDHAWDILRCITIGDNVKDFTGPLFDVSATLRSNMFRRNFKTFPPQLNHFTKDNPTVDDVIEFVDYLINYYETSAGEML